ncbi:MAG: T9SS type A sorting domain-containing protein [Chitinophagales bacterium]|nr:T9SS type A sorting domain-containing protein [Chitinophagales bacterium]
MNRIFIFLLLSVVTYLSNPQDIKAQYLLDSTAVDTSVLLSGLDIPWEMKLGPDGYIYFTERYGRISRVHPDTGVQEVLADISSSVLQIGAAGLLGIALHPSFLDTPFIYVIYTYDVDSSTLYMNERLVRFEFDGSGLINQTTLMDSIGASLFVAGSRLIVGPDRKLYVTTGCTQDFTQAQNLQSKSGKLLRLNLDGTVPQDNPYSGNPVYSLGHRNPQGLDLHNGIIYLAEHGPHNDDEINIIQAKGNYGWPNVEGYCDDTSETQYCIDSMIVEPLYSYIATIGISEVMFYEGNAFPEFENSLLQLSLKNQRIYVVKLDSSGQNILYQNQYFHYEFGRLRDILQMPDGRLFVAGQPPQNDPFNHYIFELKPAGIPTCATPANPDTAISNDTVTFSWDPVPGATQYEIRAKTLPVGEYQKFTYPAGQTSVTYPFVPPGFYGWQVSAKCGTVKSPVSVMEIFKVGIVTPPSSCPIPDPPFTNNIQKTSAQLNWDPVEDAQTHIVRGGIAGSNLNSWLYFDTKSTSNNFIASGLTPGVSYQWQVRAVCDTAAGDSSGWSQVGAFTTLICRIPKPIHSVINTSSSATLYWTPVSNAIFYEIWGKDVNTSSIVKLIRPGSDTSYHVTGLDAQKTYIWSVFTHCDSNRSLISKFALPPDTISGSPKGSSLQGSYFSEFRILPNPNDGRFTITYISTEKVDDVKVHIYDHLGKLVHEELQSGDDFINKHIDLQHLPKGVYMLEIGNDKFAEKRRIVLQ